MANVRGVGEGGTLQDAFREVPMVTKLLVCGTLLMTVVSSFNLYSVENMVFDMGRTWRNFEVQRLVLPYLYAGSFSFPFAMHLWMLYDFCRRYEANPFNTGAGGTSADFLWMVLLGMLVCGFVNYLFLEMPILSEPLLYMIVYVWSRREPDVPQKIFGLGPIKSIYLPFVYMAIRTIMGGSISGMILGIVTGHAYYFFYEIMPEMYPAINLRRFSTPAFCRSAQEYFTGMSVPVQGIPPRANAARAGFPAAAAAPQGGAGQAAAAGGNNFGGSYNWGGSAGRRLGTQ